MANHIGLLYVGNEAYVNTKFTLFPGQGIVVDGDLGARLLNDFPTWFESFDEGVNEIVELVGLNTPYNYLNQLNEFEADNTPSDEDLDNAWNEDEDGTEAPPEALDEPTTPEEVALDNAVNELVDDLVTEAVMAALTKNEDEDKA